jgi:hypothetical protein
MRHHDHALGRDDVACDFYRVEVFLVDSNVPVVIAYETVRDDKGGPQDCIVEPVLERGGEVVDGIMPTSRIERVCVGNKRLSAARFYPLDDLPDELRAKV